MSDLATRNGGRRCLPRLRTIMLLAAAMLPALGQAQTTDICGRTAAVRDAILTDVSHSDCATVPTASLNGLIGGLGLLGLQNAGLTAVASGDFAGLTSLQRLYLNINQLTSLPSDLFDGLTSLQRLFLHGNELTSLHEDLFDGLTSLTHLHLQGNELTSLHENLFDGLTSLTHLYLQGNELTSLHEDLFDGLTNLQLLWLNGNELTSLHEDLFDGLTNLDWLSLSRNQLTNLPEGLFDGLTNLNTLRLQCNRLGVLSRSNPLFADIPAGADLTLTPQGEGCDTAAPIVYTPPVYLTLATGAGDAGVPFFAPSSHPMRQGFLRILNTQTARGDGALRVTAFNDAGQTVGPAELPFKRLSGINYTAADIMEALELPAGNWRFKVDSYWQVSVLSYVRTNDGFLTPAHDALQRNADGRLVVPLFNPASNEKRVGQLRLVNTGEDAAEASIEGFDDEGTAAGPVTLTLAAGETRTLSALELEQGGEGLAGTLGDGNGKWRLLVKATPSVVGLNLLEATSGHLTNLSTMGRPAGVAAVPLLEAGASTRSGFVRIVNQTASAGMVRITAVDDMGNAESPFDLAIAANGAIHFNAGDLADGNMGKGVPALGRPAQGDWRLNVETELEVGVLSYVRANDGYLAPLHDLMERETNDRRKRLVAPIFMPPGGDAGTSLLRLVNTGEDAAQVNAVVFTDQPSNGLSSIYVNFELAPGEARTLSALDLNNMAERPLEGDNYWYLKIDAGPSVLGMNLLESNSGHLANLSTMGGARWERDE